MADDVLNPRLYKRLLRTFGEVKIVARGEEMLAYGTRGGPGDSPRLMISHVGETYCVSCPYCGDTRFRLHISYRYGQRDTFGRLQTFLALCFNETGCMAERENRWDLWETLNRDDGLVNAEVRPGKVVPESLQRAQPPGPVTLLSELEGHHKARRYLAGRGFDPDVLSRVYRVGYCPASHLHFARDRIIVPVHAGGCLKGWQARYIGELGWGTGKKDLPPKYFTMPGMPKSGLLYNLDRARKYRTIVLVEGPSDVWSFGPMAVCSFGCAPSAWQRETLIALMKRRTLVLLYDPEALGEKQVIRAVKEFRAAPGRFLRVKLPAGTDPGGLGRKVLRALVAEQAAKKGITVDYRER